jgi:hypothetical protein
MKPMLEPALKGEGKWTSLDKDPFVGKNPGAPSPFVFSFIRTDRKRIYTQIFVTLWDPRQVELHPVSGTVEPRSATGETGAGEVPRKPEVMSRLVGAFNGGFQAIHGEFGMMADRVVYLPPKPYSATVAELADGSTGFGTWPESSAIPKDIVGFRQNMTPLIVDEVPNPYKRHWWGGVPPGWTQESRTVRSGLCMTREVSSVTSTGPRSTRGAFVRDAARALRARTPPRHERRTHRARILSSGSARQALASVAAARGFVAGARQRSGHGRLGVHEPAHDPTDGADEFSSLRRHGTARLFLPHAASRLAGRIGAGTDRSG